MVNYEGALKRPFTDIKKLVIGTVVEMIPIVNLIGMGFMLECARTPKKAEMPEWDTWGDYFVKGLIAFVIGLIYSLPAIIVIVLTGLTALGSIFAAAGSGSGEEVAALIFGGMGLGMLFGLFLMIVAWYFLPMAYVEYAVSGKFGNAMKIGDIAKKTMNANYLVAWILVGIITIVISAILSWIPWLGWALGSFVSGVIMATVFGELYQEISGEKKKETVVAR